MVQSVVDDSWVALKEVKERLARSSRNKKKKGVKNKVTVRRDE